MTEKTSKPKARSKDVRAAPAVGYKNTSINVAVARGSTDADFAVAVARTLCQPETSAASVIENWQKDTHDVNALAAELGRQVEAVNGGDLKRAEGLLISQAHTLDNMFAILARRATGQQHLPQWEAFMRMAMKAQNQCRMTLETLANIKNPPVVFAKQANINNGGQQQVNSANSLRSKDLAHVHMAGGATHAAKAQATPIELLEVGDVQRLDTGATGMAGESDPVLATMGALHRA